MSDTKANTLDEKPETSAEVQPESELSDATLEDVAGGHMRGNIMRRRPEDLFATSVELF